MRRPARDGVGPLPDALSLEKTLCHTLLHRPRVRPETEELGPARRMDCIGIAARILDEQVAPAAAEPLLHCRVREGDHGIFFHKALQRRLKQLILPVSFDAGDQAHSAAYGARVEAILGAALAQALLRRDASFWFGLRRALIHKSPCRGRWRMR
eukprot:6197036-Pleurochrysis_carterae.AAC.3